MIGKKKEGVRERKDREAEKISGVVIDLAAIGVIRQVQMSS